MVAKFRDLNKKELKQQRQRRQGQLEKKKTKKTIDLDQQSKNSARASLFFVRFLAVVARLRRETY